MRMNRLLLVGILLTGIATPGCWFLKKKVSSKDCDKWAEHYKEALGAWADDKLEGCGKSKGPEFKKSFSKSMKKNVEEGGDTIFSSCKSMADLIVLDDKEADCFMKGKSPEEWKKCGFSTTGALNQFGVTADAMAKSIKTGCGGDDAGDDDDDKPKKKKKKKEDD